MITTLTSSDKSRWGGIHQDMKKSKSLVIIPCDRDIEGEWGLFFPIRLGYLGMSQGLKALSWQAGRQRGGQVDMPLSVFVIVFFFSPFTAHPGSWIFSQILVFSLGGRKGEGKGGRQGGRGGGGWLVNNDWSDDGTGFFKLPPTYRKPI